MSLFKNTKKYVINLKNREDRAIHIQNEMKYMEWDYELFEAIDTNSYIGCGLSHMAIAQKLLDSNEEYIMVMEDDIFFMPYTKALIEKVEENLQLINWDIFVFAPSIHRPLNLYNDCLVDLKNLPPKDENKHRGIFGTSGFIYNKKIATYIVEWNTGKYADNSHMHDAIDQYFDKLIYPNYNSFCAKLPLVTQIDSFSNINQTYDKNHYLMTYNWNSYIYPLSNNLLNMEACKILRDQKELGVIL